MGVGATAGPDSGVPGSEVPAGGSAGPASGVGAGRGGAGASTGAGAGGRIGVGFGAWAEPPDGLGAAAAAADCIRSTSSWLRRGNMNRNVLPSLGLDSTQMRPLISSITL